MDVRPDRKVHRDQRQLPHVMDISQPSAPPPCSAKVAVLTTEPLPLPGCATTGAGLRAWGLAAGLISRGFTVVIGSPAAQGESAGTNNLPRVVEMPRDEIGLFLQREEPDIVVLQHWGLAANVPDVTVPLVIDLAGPHLLERLFWGSDDPARDRREKITALRRADFVICSGEYQRRYFLPFLLEAGHDLQGENVLPVIPFSVPPPPDSPIQTVTARDELSEPLFVYGGAFLAWQDPARALTWLLEEMDAANKGRLLFVGGAHPVIDASGGRFLALDAMLRGHPRVERRGFLSFEDLTAAYREATVAVDLMTRNAERELAFTTRTMIYLWCGLPVIHDDYSEVGEIIDKNGCGWTLSPDNEAGFRNTVREILSGGAPLTEMREKALAVAGQYSWEHTITPLADFCMAPHMRVSRGMDAGVESDPNERHAAFAQANQSDTSLSAQCRRTVTQALPHLAPLAGLLAWLPAWVLRYRLKATARPPKSPPAKDVA